MHTVPTEERPEDHPVRRAIAALKQFAGPDVNRDQAAAILPNWKHYGDLSLADVVEVAVALPPGPPQRPLRGGGMSSGSMLQPGWEL